MKKNNKGFSLVEVVISIVIISIAILPIAQSIMSAARINRNAKISQEATYLTQHLMESFKAMNIIDITNSLETTGFPSQTNILDEEVISYLLKQYDQDGILLEDLELSKLVARYEYDFNILRNNTEFQVKVTLDANQYSYTDGINDFSEPTIASLNHEKDCYISDEVSIGDSTIASEFIESYNDIWGVCQYAVGYDKKSINYINELGESKTTPISKTITITLSKVNDKYKVKADVTYSVDFPYYEIDYIDLREKTIKKDAFEGLYQEIPEIYYLYTVWRATNDLATDDSFELVADSSLLPEEKMKVYFMKQQIISALSLNTNNINRDPDNTDQIDYELITNDVENYKTIIKKKDPIYRLYNIKIEVSNSNITSIVFESTKEE